MDIGQAAAKEVTRMKKIMPQIKPTGTQGIQFIDFAKNYSDDAGFFLGKEKYIEAFEAAIIAWAYLDISLKLGYIKLPDKLLKNFTK